MGDQILAIDQGTHASRASVFDADGHRIAVAGHDVGLFRFPGGRVEQDPQAILDSVRRVIDEVLTAPGVKRAAIACAGMATQRSSVVAWDRETGAALGPVLSWLDVRGADIIDRHATAAELVSRRTGLVLSPHYGASKLAWLLQHSAPVQSAARDGRLAVGPLAAYLLFHLLEERPLCVDHANAARTLLFDLDRRDWDDGLLGLFSIDRGLLPGVRPVCAGYGLLAGSGIPMTAVNGDQGAAACACGEVAPGTAIVNMGSGAFVLLPSGGRRRQVRELLGTILHSDGSGAVYAVEGTVNGAGVALDQVARDLGVTDMPAVLQAGLDGEAPPVFVNRVGGLGSPWWLPDGESRFVDAGANTDAAVRLAAAGESVVFLLQANIDAMRAGGLQVSSLRISGGLAAQDGLCRRLATLAGVDVERPPRLETTSRGIAWLAAGSPAHWQCGDAQRFAPREDAELRARYVRLLEVLRGLSAV